MANRYIGVQKCRRCGKRRRHSDHNGLCLSCACLGYRNHNTEEADPAAKPIRAARIPVYEARAALGLPLFDHNRGGRRP